MIIQAKKRNQTPLALKGAILMLLGSLLLGFVITRSVFVYQKYNSVLDTVDVVMQDPVEISQLVLDVGSPLTADVNVEQTADQAQTFVAAQFDDDMGEIGEYYMKMPKHIVIPSIHIDSEIGFSSVRDVTVFGDQYQQWVAPSDVVGWHYQSALLGEPGNTVLNGHHNVYGEVFKDLSLIQKGDEIIISSEAEDYYYQVASVMILPERFESREVRLQNARWIESSEDERITLISCWPYDSNSHRVVVVAYRIDKIIEPVGEK
jgi:sortase A